MSVLFLLPQYRTAQENESAGDLLHRAPGAGEAATGEREQRPSFLDGSARVITRYLRASWLWDQVRVRGGAYGAFCNFDKFSGVLTFLSYRDPNLLKTIKAFDGTAGFLRNAPLSGDELRKGIIGAIGDMDAYMFPDAKGYSSMVRYLTGNTDEDIQQVRDEIFATTQEDFRRFADVLDVVKDRALVKVLGSEGAIREAAGGIAPALTELKIL